jgi:hypothetical protein
VSSRQQEDDDEVLASHVCDAGRGATRAFFEDGFLIKHDLFTKDELTPVVHAIESQVGAATSMQSIAHAWLDLTRVNPRRARGLGRAGGRTGRQASGGG